MSSIRTTIRALTVATAAAGGTLVATSPAEAQSPCGGFYTIQQGDSLTDIAVNCGVTIPAILARNPEVRDDLDLTPGGRIAVPDPGADQPAPYQACGAFYTIRPGDSLREIATKCGLPVPLLLAANPGLPTQLFLAVGGKLRIPNMPRAAVEGGSISVITITDEADLDIRAAAAADSAAADSAAARALDDEMVRHDGRLDTRTGPCPRIVTADGPVALVGEVELGRVFAHGDSVSVLGEPVTMDRCGDMPKIRLRIVWKPGRPGG